MFGVGRLEWDQEVGENTIFKIKRGVLWIDECITNARVELIQLFDPKEETEIKSIGIWMSE